jgi:hypothetical protein
MTLVARRVWHGLGDGLAVDLDAALNVLAVRDWQDARRAHWAGADGIIADYP